MSSGYTTDYEKARLLGLMSDKGEDFPEEFFLWLPDNMAIWFAFVTEATKVRAKGFKKYSARTIVHFLRHHTAMAEASSAGWKINNNHSPYLARLFDLRYPSMSGMWEYRITRKTAK